MKRRLILLCVIFLLVIGLAVDAYAVVDWTGDRDKGAVVRCVGTQEEGSNLVTFSFRAVNFDMGLSAFRLKVLYNYDFLEYVDTQFGEIFASYPGATMESETQPPYESGKGNRQMLQVTFNSNRTDDRSNADFGGSKDVELFRITLRIRDGAPNRDLLIESYDQRLLRYGPNLDNPSETIAYNVLAGFEAAVLEVTHVHSYGEWVVDAEPTCTETGSRHKTCISDACDNSGDGQRIDEVIPALGHKTTLVPAVEPTCTEDGNIDYYKCDVCGLLFNKDLNGISDAAETESSTITLEDTVADKLGHDAKLVEQVDPTCEEVGYKEHYECARCSKWLLKDEATGDYEEIEEKDPVVTIQPLGHDPQFVEYQFAGCLTDGCEAHYECGNGCGTWFRDADGNIKTTPEEMNIPATGHNWNEGEITKPSTCIELGVMTITCQNEHCEIVSYTEDIDYSDHAKPEDPTLITVVQPTGREEGYTKYICTVCGEEITEIIPPTGEVEEEPESTGRRAPLTLDWAESPLWICIFAFFLVGCGAAYATKKRHQA